jgi:hypothetical protein
MDRNWLHIQTLGKPTLTTTTSPSPLTTRQRWRRRDSDGIVGTNKDFGAG